MLKRAVKRLARTAGVHVVPAKVRKVGTGLYGPVIPKAKYSPWRSNGDFQRIYSMIKGHTLVDEYRCFELWELVAQTLHLPGDVLEVGVWRGGTGALLASRAGTKTTYLCDTFSGVVKAGANDPTYRGGEHSDTSAATVEQLVSRTGGNARVLTGIFPDDFPDIQGPFCFVHIDVDAYQSAKDVFDFVWPRVPVGGLVVFDDYGFQLCAGIPPLIAEYRGDTDKIVIHNLNGHAVIVKTA